MKCRVKSKSDKNKTGNQKIYLKKWEHELFELLSAESNPAIGKVTSNFSVGVNANESSSSNLESAVGINNDSSTSSAAVQNTPVDIPSVPQQQTSKRKLNDNEHDIRPVTLG
ncbi:uncharacterized protein LOC129249774 [Anastrepha obliqua]|uniref:uncharacterized protein LOC129249774 n=1 Tax=Anastrepha obliqua TaxID=95512 RepID=UPI00240A5BF0|nr:uncharacterized protein LOC129249774 [Anastrepha obliqua]